MKRIQAGFTLIELIIVIIILGILAAVAIPNYINLKQEAALAAVNGVAGSISSSMSINFAARTVNPAAPNSVPVTTCAAGATVLRGGLPTAGGVYTILVPATAVAAGAAVTCTLQFTPTGGAAVTSPFTALGIL